jgi:hypothetical protein
MAEDMKSIPSYFRPPAPRFRQIQPNRVKFGLSHSLLS